MDSSRCPLPGYRVLRPLSETPDTLLLEAVREEDGRRVTLKVLNATHATPERLGRYRQDYEALRSIDAPNVIKAYALEPCRGGLCLVLESFGGTPLRELIPAWKRAGTDAFPVETFLTLAGGIVDGLAAVHAAGIIHRNLNPGTISLDAATGSVRIVNFEIATRLSREIPALANPRTLEGALAYVSPEQTGRMNRTVDYRTDFYSLGVTLYELLTGRLPFESADPMELVHAHLARTPAAPRALNPAVPEAVSDIVLKLMAKAPEDRYQSARGVKRDLALCLQRWQARGTVLRFDLGRDDRAEHFLIPERLYGRTTDVEALLQAFERAARGRAELMLVSGGPGIGKTAVVREVHKAIVSRSGFFVQGKFDSLKRDIPLSAFAEGLRELMRQLHAEPEPRREEWRRRLQGALGDGAQVLVDVIPEIEWILGPQPPAPGLPGPAARDRFHLLFHRLITVFATPEHPLVVFLDDLQWVDPASLALVHQLMTDPALKHLLLIGAYRDNEVAAAHPLRLAIAEIARAGVAITSRELLPLTAADVNVLIADSLGCAPGGAASLTTVVYRITQGNPFYSNQLLTSLYDEGLITFDPAAGAWRCDLSQVNALDLTEDVVQFLGARLQKLPAATLDVVTLAACVGGWFDLDTLAVACDRPPVDVSVDLWPALAVGLVVRRSAAPHPDPDGRAHGSQRDAGRHGPLYRFLHDRVRQAAYSLIPDAQRPHSHLRIARLLAKSAGASRADLLFEIVNHFNRGVALIADKAERRDVAALNVEAGQKAKAAAAFQAAWDYFAVARGLLPDSTWQDDYAFTLDLYQSSVEAAYLSGQFEAMEDLAAVVLREARTLLDQVKVFEVKSQALAAQTKLLEAVETGLQVLEMLGTVFPRDPTPVEIERALERTRSAYSGRAVADLADLPPMTDPEQLAAMRILSSILPAAFLSVPALYALIVLKQVELSVTYGNTPAAAFGYASYGLILCGNVGDIESGYEFGQLALELVRRLDAREWHPKVTAVVHSFITHWRRPVADTLAPLREAYQSGLDVGDFQFAGYSAVLHVAFAYFAGIGRPLAELQQDAASLCESISRIRQTTVRHYFEMLLQALHDLREGRTPSPYLTGRHYDEEAMLPEHRQAQDWNALFYVALHKLLLDYLLGDYRQAVADAGEVEASLAGAKGFPYPAVYHLYDSLARLAAARERGAAPDPELRRRIEANQEKLRTWAHFAPENCRHKWHLVEAERFRALGEREKAIDEYERAIEGARNNGYVRDEAVANELAAGFFLDWGKERLARPHMQEAHDGYAGWGARAKALQLERLYPRLLSPGPATARDALLLPAPAAGGGGSESVGASLDLTTVVKASQAVSGEIDLERLLRQLMRLLMENAGAQRGALILERDGEWVVEAQGDVDGNMLSVLLGCAVASSDAVSAAIVGHVARTGETVVLDDALGAGAFTADPHVRRHRVRSVICSPLVNQGRLSAIVYLENNRATRAFTSERLELLNLLSAQMALSLDNARLYRTAQQELAERRRSEETLRQFKAIFDTANFGVVITDAAARITYVNECMAALHGWCAEDLRGEPVTRLHNEEQREQVIHLHQQVISGVDFSAREIWHCRRDGTAFPMLMTAQAVRDLGQTPRFVAATAIDLTERKVLEAQLQQAQKMESVGRLAGGVAHDFNNMLNVILGHTELALETVTAPDPLHADLTAVHQAARRSADLTRQLLAFARKQTVAPKVLDINETVEGMLKMLQRLIGENVHLEWRPTPGLWDVRVDPSQLDQVLANLCVNARDAISDIGTVTIEAGNAVLDQEYCAAHAGFVAGEYVRLVVSDDGCGMDKETLAHVFEPFFTTKGVGGGTGLGLATVYGVVKQNEGFINAYSEPGHGSTFSVYLPRYVGKAGAARTAASAQDVRRGHETILLVEDEPAILNITRVMLERLGYRVLPAGTPGQAIELARQYAEEIDLLVTDVVMPEMSGRDLAKNLLSLYPRMRRLFTSGYTANIIAHHGVLDEGVCFLQKPFSTKDLGAKVREALDRVSEA